MKVLSLALIFLFGLEADLFSQCTSGKIYSPLPGKAQQEEYGTSIDVDGRTMIVSAIWNDSLEYDCGIAYIYELNQNEKWTKVATLAPSQPQRQMNFGNWVTINSDFAAISAGYYVNDKPYAEIFIFEKPADGKWISTIESYRVPYRGLIDMQFAGNQLLTITESLVISGGAALNVYDNVSGKFALSKSIQIPNDVYNSNVSHRLIVDGNLVVVMDPQFTNPNNHGGAVFLYERNNGVIPDSPTARIMPLTSTSKVQSFFGMSVAIRNDVIFVTGTTPIGSNNQACVYYFAKPVDGWHDMEQSIVIAEGNFWGDGLAQGSFERFNALVVENDELLVTDADRHNLIGYKSNNGDWLGTLTNFIIPSPNVNNTDFGCKVLITDKHIIANNTGKFWTSTSFYEQLIDYYSPDNNWSAISTANQIMNESSVNSSGAQFGEDIDVNDDQLFVGAKWEARDTPSYGSVYVYDVPSGMTQPFQIITHPEGSLASTFGAAISANESTLYIGAPADDLNFSEAGRVFVYKKENGQWKYKSALIAPQPKQGGYFGISVECYKDYVAICEFNDRDTNKRGYVHIFKEMSDGQFNHLAVLRPTNDIEHDYFGREMIMNDSMLVIGTGNPETYYLNQMRVYVFMKHGEWGNATEDAQLVSSDKIYGDGFGRSIAMYNDIIVVGASLYPSITYNGTKLIGAKGAVYIFKKPPNGWKGLLNQVAKLTPSDPVDFGAFGESVAIDHGDIFVAMPTLQGWSSKPFQPGKIYHYKMQGDIWVSTNQEYRQIHSLNADSSDFFAMKILLNDRQLYAGSPFHDTSAGFESGSVETSNLPPIIEPLPKLCISSQAVRLIASPKLNGVWTGNGVDPATGLFNPSIAGAGNHTITYSALGCTTSIMVEVSELPANTFGSIQESVVRCLDNQVLVQAEINNSIQYQWFKKDNSNNFQLMESGSNSISIESAGIYRAKALHQVCPSIIKDFEVIDDVPPAIQIEPILPICDERPITLTVTPTGGEWSGNGVSINGIIDGSSLNDGGSILTYTYKDANNCNTQKQLPISIDKLTASEIIQQGDKICLDIPVKLSVEPTQDAMIVTWFKNDNFSSSVGSGQTFTVSEPGNYKARLAKYNCETIIGPSSIVASKDSLFVPNVVTTHADGLNDFFKVTSGDINNLHVFVVNRLGQLVFEADGSDFKWDPANHPSGVYYWRITYSNCANEQKEQVGWLQVLR